ncbi:uncharacterized protein LOC109002026 [Juglans regia]|nr:uncharacterized protein LOC109002026 [Juglans regia]
MLKDREAILKILKDNLREAQEMMKKFADLNRTEREFTNGNWVYLRLKPYHQLSVAARRNQKLATCYYGPFMIEEKVGKVAYCLRLPPESKIHPIFHVSSLKKRLGSSSTLQPKLPPVNMDGSLFPEPEKTLNRRLKR